MTGHVPEISGHDTEIIGHAVPKYAIGGDQEKLAESVGFLYTIAFTL